MSGERTAPCPVAPSTASAGRSPWSPKRSWQGWSTAATAGRPEGSSTCRTNGPAWGRRCGGRQKQRAGITFIGQYRRDRGPRGKGNVRTLSGAQKFRSKSEIVYDFLKLNILNGKLKSGERIAVSEVAKILGISGIPITGGIDQARSGRSCHHHPAYRCKRHQHRQDQARRDPCHPDRIGRSGDAVGLQLLKEEDFERLEQILKESEVAFAAADYKELTELNESFHFTIYRSCPNQSLNKMIVELLNKSRFASSSLVISESRAKNSIEEHRLIVQALKANDGERASQIVKQQKKDSWATISKSIPENS